MNGRISIDVKLLEHATKIVELVLEKIFRAKL